MWLFLKIVVSGILTLKISYGTLVCNATTNQDYKTITTLSC